jgi:4-amino-4-deoxy-L-arabinose transferase-like glycosyltransferase
MPAEFEQSAAQQGSRQPVLEREDTEARSERLVPKGNPLRPRALLLLIPGLLVLWLLMASPRHFGFSVPLGALAALVAAYGLLDLLGTFDDPGPVAAVRSISEFALPGLAALTTLLGLIAAVRLAVAGVLPHPVLSAGLSITLLSVGCLSTWYTLFSVLSGPTELPLWRREGFWLLSLAMVLYLPLLGSYSLIDPWETHYGEVAREMIARDDWISFWWAQEGWFWSKPALDFWLQGLSFLLFGVRYRPDQMLSAASEGAAPWPEWAARLPIVALSLIASYLAYKAVARVAGRRAGLLGGLVLVTSPYWFLLAHQSMTDMPYVAPLTAALALLLIGLNMDPDAPVASYAIQCGRRQIRVSLAHAVLLAVLVTALPQIVYLVSRNVTLGAADAQLLSLHADRFFSGSGAGNCGLPGNEPCEPASPVNQVFQPAVGAVVWTVALGLFLWANRGERRQQRWAFLAAWYFVALAVLAKGAPALVLSLVVSVAAVCVSRRFRELARLELVGFLLLVSVVALPWYVQAFMRHGAAFSDRLLFYDMYKRAFVHVHDTNAGDDVSFRYYVWQLGYGLFPWTGLAVAGLVSAFSTRDEAENRRARLHSFLLLWFLLAFAMFSVSLTKFHHYALPALPPLALLTGLLLDRLLGPALRSDESSAARFTSAKLGLFCLFAAGIAALVGRDLSSPGAVEGQVRLYHLFAYNYARPWPRTLDFDAAFRVFALLAALLLALMMLPSVRVWCARAFLVLAAVFTAFCLSIYLVRLAPHYGQRETLLTYYATRAGPEEPLVAYQMNWKGENFYTGNHLPAFVTSGEKFKSWVASRREAGTRVLYFTTEHSRVGTLKSELGKVKSFQVLTKPELNNKFFLARVEL